MAITAVDVALWQELARRETVPPAPSVIEIGQANWHGDIPPPDGYPNTNDAESFAAARKFWVETLRPEVLTAIDLQGQSEWSLRYNLNEPIPARHLLSSFDVLINTGTAEHVFNQGMFWQNCHDLVRKGGLMVHGVPWTGWLAHGLYNYQPGFFFDLAYANHYEILLLWCTSIKPLSIRPVFVDGKAGESLMISPSDNTMLHVVLKKGPDQPFKTPMQSGYAVGVELANDWHGVHGWLTHEEGVALQELARGKRVLELGAWKGRSTCCLAEVAARVASVDTFEGDEGTGKGDTYREWLDNVRSQGHENKSWAIRARFADAMPPESIYHLAYVDGDHSADGTEEATRLALRCLVKGGTIALHDWHLDSVREGAARCGLVEPAGCVGNLAWFKGVR